MNGKKKVKIWWINKLYLTNWNRIILYSIIGLVITPWFTISNINEANFPYILSSLSQGLAAIITILITILIVTLQMSEKYVYIDLIFDWKTYLLILFYIIAITVPLFVLKTKISYLWLNISIDLGIIALGILFVFIKRILNIIKFCIGIPKLTGRMYNERDLHNFPLYEGVLTDIEKLTQDVPPKIAEEYFLAFLDLKIKLIYKIRLWRNELLENHYEFDERSLLDNTIYKGVSILFNLRQSYGKHKSEMHSSFDDILDFYDEILSTLPSHYVKLSSKQTISATILIGIISIQSDIQEIFERSVDIIKNAAKNLSNLKRADSTIIYICSLGYWLIGVYIYKIFSDNRQKKEQYIKYLFESMSEIEDTSFVEQGYENTKEEIEDEFTRFGLFSLIPLSDEFVLESPNKITQELPSLFAQKDLVILEELKEEYDRYKKERIKLNIKAHTKT